MDQGPNRALKTLFLNMAITLEWMKIEHQKIFDTCLGVFQNLDQGPDGALKTVVLKYG